MILLIRLNGYNQVHLFIHSTMSLVTILPFSSFIKKNAQYLYINESYYLLNWFAVRSQSHLVEQHTNLHHR